MKSLYNHKATAVWNEFVTVNKYEHSWGSDHGLSGEFYRSQELAPRIADALLVIEQAKVAGMDAAERALKQ
jgi:hypothetical protein